MGIRKVVKMFEKGSVCVTGMKGRGKDLLIANVVVRRDVPYVSNVDYGGDFAPLRLDLLTMGGNTYDNFINGNIAPYKHPYERGADIYISDVGVYLPSQYCNELNKKYPYLPTYFALSRQVSGNNVHINVQNLNRCWDKVREMSDIFIKCNWCKVVCGIVIQHITVYDRAESCQSRVAPCRVTVPIFANAERKLQARIYMDTFYNTHGTVKNMLLVYRNKSNYDTLIFEKLLGVTYEDTI